MKTRMRNLAIWLITLIFMLPIIWMVIIAFKPPADITQTRTDVISHYFSLASFATLWKGDLPTLAGNTLLIALSATVLSLGVAFLATYALVRYRFPARLDKFFLLAVLVIKMMPPIVVAVPLYTLMNQLGLLNSRLGLILVYQIYTLPFCIWMLLGFMRDIPLEIEEAGVLDGAHLFSRLRYIILPLCGPGLVATAIFAIILGWNEFLFSLLFIHTPDKFTIPLFIANFMTEDGTAWGELMAIGMVSSLPMLALAGYLQRYLLRGFSMGLK